MLLPIARHQSLFNGVKIPSKVTDNNTRGNYQSTTNFVSDYHCLLTFEKNRCFHPTAYMRCYRIFPNTPQDTHRSG